MLPVRTAHTADLTTVERARVRDLLDRAFDGGFTDHDWEHALGGLHVLVVDGGIPVAHAAVVQRRFRHDDRTRRGGYLEAVAVHPRWRGRGLATAVLGPAERIIDHAYELGALSASAAARGLYLARGWLPWQGETWALSPSGPVRTADEDESTLVRIVPGTALHLTGSLACDWRDGDVW